MRNVFQQKGRELMELKNRNLSLKKDIAHYEELENYKQRNLFCLKELYGRSYFKRLPLSFINTAFYTKANLIYPHINSTFDNQLIKSITTRMVNLQENSMVLSFAMLCVGVSKAKDGPVLTLQEPFKIIQTKPLHNTKIELARSWINRILIVDLNITTSALNDFEFEAGRIKVLNLTKSGIIKDGVELPFSWTETMVQITDYRTNTFISDKRILEKYKDVSGRDACTNALSYMEYYYTNKCIIPPYRENDNTLWIRFEYEAIGIFYHNDVLEMIYQPKENIKDLFNNDGSMTQYNECQYDFTQHMYNQLYKNYDVISESEFLKQVKIDACMINSDYYSRLIQASRT